MRNTKPVSEASELNSQTLATRQRRARCAIWIGCAEPVWACRVSGVAASISSLLADRASRGKAGHLRVHGLLIERRNPCTAAGR